MVGRKVAVLAIVALLMAPLAWAGIGGGPVPPVGGGGSGVSNRATAKLSNANAGARTALTIGVRTELQCSRLAARTVIVRLPSDMLVPHRIEAAAVTLGGKPAAHVAVNGSTVVLALPLPRGAICDVLGPGVYRVVFSARAGLRNPIAAGAYAFSVAASPRGSAWRGTLSVG